MLNSGGGGTGIGFYLNGTLVAGVGGLGGEGLIYNGTNNYTLCENSKALPQFNSNGYSGGGGGIVYIPSSDRWWYGIGTVKTVGGVSPGSMGSRYNAQGQPGYSYVNTSRCTQKKYEFRSCIKSGLSDFGWIYIS